MFVAMRQKVTAVAPLRSVNTLLVYVPSGIAMRVYPKKRAKVLLFFDMTKYFVIFFQKK